MSAQRLYTPRVLELATSLADLPLDAGLPLRGAARSKSCGSTITIGLALDADGRIARIGVSAQACAVGQAAAALFATGAKGRSAHDIGAAESAMAAWLGGDGPMPDWPGLDAIGAARDYPARHGAVMLAWRAAREALSSPGPAG